MISFEDMLSDTCIFNRLELGGNQADEGQMFRGDQWWVPGLVWESGCTHFREEPALWHSDVFPTLAVREIIGS